MQQKYFLGYVSANETNFFQDFVNIYLMTRHRPGVKKIELYLIFSEVKELSKFHKKALSFLSYLVSGCIWLELKSIIWKTNIGRDFSSADVFLSNISAIASQNDVVMNRNRSSYGPYLENWY